MNTTLLKTNRPSSPTLVNFVSSVLSHSPNSGYTYASLPLKFPLETSYVRHNVRRNRAVRLGRKTVKIDEELL